MQAEETKGERLTIRLPRRLTMVLERDAKLQGRRVSDQARLALELSAHLAMLARVRDKEIQRELKASGRDPAKYEAGLVDELRQDFLKLYGRPMPKDTYDLLTEVQSD